MELIQKKDNQITFKAKISESLANAIRRYIHQIPVLAIDEVEISQNGSALYDEVVAHRLGLIPIKKDKAITEKNHGKIKLHSKKEGMVTSGEISGNVDVVYNTVPITYLDKDQELELTATTKYGTGNEHVKFAPGLMFYRNVSEITMDKSLLEEVKKACPKAEIKEKGDKIIVVDDGAGDISDVCEGICEDNDKKCELSLKDELILTLESFGQMDVKEILSESVKALIGDLEEVAKKAK